MKQKLLNLFTWRATLLVALLSCAFSAWGEGSTTLTFSGSSRSVSFDDVTWGITNGSYSDNSWKSSSSTACTFTTTSSIKGKIKSIVVNAKASQSDKTTVDVKVNNSALGSTVKPGTDYKDYTFKKSDNSTVDVDGTNIIVVSAKGANGGKTVYIKSITVTYEAPSVNTFTISENCYGLDGDGNEMKFGTYSNTCQFVLPTGVTASKISVTGGVLTLTPLSGIIPANTGILVSSSSAVNSTVDFRLATATADVSNNMLVASSIAMTGDNKFYRLTMKNGTDIGFYYGDAETQNGSAFTIDPNKAYLAVPSGQTGVKGFSFSDMVNGIKAIETETERKVIYNLAGQRVSKMQKGIYVVNGKKVLVK